MKRKVHIARIHATLDSATSAISLTAVYTGEGRLNGG
jgi:hypothetical protein